MASLPVGSWKVSFCQGMDPDLGGYSFLDGSLHLWDKNWLVLSDHLGSPLISQHFTENPIQVGSTIMISNYRIRVLSVISILKSSSGSALSSLEVTASGSGLGPLVGHTSGSLPFPSKVLDVQTPNFNTRLKCWKISYSTYRDLDRARMKSYDGTLEMRKADNFLILNNAKGKQIGCRFLKSSDRLSVGTKLFFPLHVVKMGVELQSTFIKKVIPNTTLSPPEPAVAKPLVLQSEIVKVSPKEATDNSQISMAVYDSITLGLDFSHGITFSSNVRKRFGSTIHPLGSSDHFYMVVSFGRAKFKLFKDSVGIALEASIGGLCDDLMVTQLSDRVFWFSVNAKSVGFMVHDLRSFSCAQFKCYFHLWGHGGPNWSKEFSLWQKECDNDWVLISPGKKRATQAMNALKKKPPRPIFKRVQSSELAKKKLVFAENISYSACSGYSAPGVILPKGIETSSTSITFGTIDYSTRPSSNVQVSEVPSAPITTNSHNLHDNSIVGDESFENMMNDMVFKVYECDHCLGFGHNKESCTNEIRCRACFFYGHKEKNYLSKQGKSLVWRPKATRQKKTLNPKDPIPNLAVSSPLSPAPDTLLSSPPSSPDRNSSPRAASMVAFELDPARWVPMGHHLVDGGPTSLPRTCYTPSEDL
jgi:hypothetical protein